MNYRRKWIQSHCALQLGECFFEAPQWYQQQGEPLMCRCVARTEFYGTFVFSFGGGEIVVIVSECPTQGRVCFSQAAIDFQRLTRDQPPLPKGLVGA